MKYLKRIFIVLSLLTAPSLAFGSSLTSHFQVGTREAFEVYQDGQYYFYDNSLKTAYYHLDNELLADYDDLIDDPFLVLRTKVTKPSKPFNLKHSKKNLDALQTALEIDIFSSTEPNIWKSASTDIRATDETLLATFLDEANNPTFILQAELGSKVWWQICSSDQFEKVISNLSRIESASSEVQLDSIAQTFLNPKTPYFFHYKTYKDGKWSEWSESLCFEVQKPKSVRYPRIEARDEKCCLSWEEDENHSQTFYVYGSNQKEFIPGYFTHNKDEHLVCTTLQNFVLLEEPLKYYRIIVEKEGRYSVPSALIYNEMAAPVITLGLEAKQRKAQTPYPPACPPLFHPHIWEGLKFYFLPADHPMKRRLDRIFSKVRATQNEASLLKAGLKANERKTCSGVTVCRHPKLKGYLIKLYRDDQPQYNDWELWLKRLVGAMATKGAIDRHQFNHILKVPKKWIYPLPESPAPTNVDTALKKHFVLIVEDMNICRNGENYAFWRGPKMTEQLLKSIYTVIQEEGLFDSVYPFNVPLCKDKRLAFIDTEYYHHWPVPFEKLLYYLSPTMQIFLCELVAGIK